MPTGPLPPWLALYPARVDPTPKTAHGSVVEAWRARVAANPERAAVRYFDGSLSAAELDAHADALATELQSRGVSRGDRVGIYLQNVPHYPISLLAIWKA